MKIVAGGNEIWWGRTVQTSGHHLVSTTVPSRSGPFRRGRFKDSITDFFSQEQDAEDAEKLTTDATDNAA